MGKNDIDKSVMYKHSTTETYADRVTGETVEKTVYHEDKKRPPSGYVWFNLIKKFDRRNNSAWIEMQSKLSWKDYLVADRLAIYASNNTSRLPINRGTSNKEIVTIIMGGNEQLKIRDRDVKGILARLEKECVIYYIEGYTLPNGKFMKGSYAFNPYISFNGYMIEEAVANTFYSLGELWYRQDKLHEYLLSKEEQ